MTTKLPQGVPVTIWDDGKVTQTKPMTFVQEIAIHHSNDGVALTHDQLSQLLQEARREGFEAARERIYNYDRPVMGNLPFETKLRYEDFADYERARGQK